MKSIFSSTLLITCLMLPVPAETQAPMAGDGTRLGISVGGISTVGVTVEFFQDTHSIDLSLGTWSFRDISVSAVAKRYIGRSTARPFVGAGLWMLVAAPGDQRTGLALVLRAPMGIDWAPADRHAIGTVLNLNRGLWVRRTDPADELPMNKRLVPLPELYYRLSR